MATTRPEKPVRERSLATTAKRPPFKRKQHPLKVLAREVNEASLSLGFRHLAPIFITCMTWKIYDGPTIRSTPTLKSQVWELFEHNMHDMYVQAEDPDIPWDPPAKEKELFHKLSRFILLYNSAEELEAFCMFRFEADKNYEGKMQFMVYIYEVQVAEGSRGTGICRRMLGALEQLCAGLKVQLFMLTCFRCNSDALPVYEHLGFKQHVDTTETAVVFFKLL
ncbi:hypothetical protein CTheo_2131 [Ceratobasidium theobromae]|uniref:N-alpha-acetyltransferase 40 n=1 Tax=Ceratobasidium theobromae TaxID=1582974 RepID=A0A5N5QRM5_9AGAM|nr:hypothetical protein CTheo_2131 [Ceratobasidium theobromae]